MTDDADKLFDNYAAVMKEITKAKPASTEGRNVISISTTMGSGIPADPGKATEKDIFPERADAVSA